MTLLDLFKLDGKVAIVTGASSGLGVAFAQAFAEAGADVALGARRVEKMADTAALVEGAGRRALAGRITSLLIFCFAAWTMTSIPHPAWFVAAACAAILFAAFVADRAFGQPRL